MKRETRNAAKSRQEIIEKSAAVFNVYGYSGAKMQMIIDATGYQKGGIYCHFESKEELAKESFLHNVQQLKSIYFNDISMADSPTDQIKKFKKNYQAFLKRPTLKGGCPILNTATEVDDTNSEFRSYVKNALDDLFKKLKLILIEGQKSGEFNQEFKPKEEVNFMLATMEGAVLLGQIHQNTKLVLNISDKLFDSLFSTIGIH